MSSTPRKPENLFLNLIFNIALPSLVLSKLSTPERMGPVAGLVVALAFPLGYGVWDYAKRRHANFISIIGLASVLLTGGLGLLHISVFWFAVKEGVVPAIIGLAVLFSLKTKTPLVRALLYNEQVIDVAWSGTRKRDPKTGKVPSVGSTVDEKAASYANTIGDLTDTTSGLDTLEASFSIRAAAQMRRNADAMYGSALSYSNPDGEHH